MPSASAEGTLQGSRLLATDQGQADATGVAFWTGWDAAEPVGPGDMKISASEIDVVLERAPTHTGVGGVELAWSAETHTTRATWQQATMALQEQDALRHLMLWGETASAHIEATQSSWGVTKTPALREPFRKTSTPEAMVSVEDKYALSGDLQRIVFTGDLTMVVRGIAFDVQHADGAEELDTRAETRQHADAVVTEVRDVRERYATLVLRDARVEVVPAAALDTDLLFATAGGFATQGTVLVREPTGTFLGVEAPPGAQAVQATGDMIVRLLPSAGGRVHAAVDGEPSSMLVDGHVVQAPADVPAWVLLAGTAIPLMALALLIGSTHRARHARLQRALARGALERVVRQGPRLFKGHFGEQARLAVTVALLRQRRGRSALRMLEDLRTITPATRAMLHAHAAALLGDAASAQRHLAECLRYAPRMRAHLQNIPDLAPFLTDRGGYA